MASRRVAMGFDYIQQVGTSSLLATATLFTSAMYYVHGERMDVDSAYVRKIKAFEARVAWHEENAKLLRKAERKHDRLSAKQKTLEEQGLIGTPDYEDCARKVKKWAQLRNQFKETKYPGEEASAEAEISS